MDPKGWIWRSGGYQHRFLKEVRRSLLMCCSPPLTLLHAQFMLQVLDVRDALDSDRFVQVHFDPVCEQKMSAGTLAAPDAPQGECNRQVEITVP